MNMKMKTLSLALVGLAGFGFAGAAAAGGGCPAEPNPPWTTATATFGTMSIDTGGYDGSACKLSVALNQSALSFAKSIVTDTTPADEPRYRAQFLIDTTELAAMNSVLRQANIFSASAQSSPAAGVSSDQVKMVLVGGPSGPALRILVADANDPTNFSIIDEPLAVALGVNRIEFDLTSGSSATFTYWISNEGTTTAEGSPTGSLAIDNTGWSGVTQASLGLFSASGNYRSNLGNTAHLYVDQFDSRRTTFIGNN